MTMRSFRGWRTLASLAVLLAAATPAAAVHVNPQGLGQVLLFPYYTVNRQQQTYVSIVNGDTAPQAFQLTVREGYNGREVLGLTVFLAGGESWTATLFASDDVGPSDGGAALLTADRSCTLPDIWTQNDGMVGGRPYRRFSTAALDDGGPQMAARTREGSIEVVALSRFGLPVSGWLAPPEGGTRDCASVRQADFASPDLQGGAPAARLFGAAGIIDVGQGTYLSQRAVAIAGFTAKPLIAQRGQDPLGLGNDGDADTVTAHVSVNGREVEAVYPRERSVDALSAVLTQTALFNEYMVDPALNAGSDWVVTLPTKRFYTDPALLPTSEAIAPFKTPFAAPGESCSDVDVRYSDRSSGRYGEAVWRLMPIGPSIEGPAMCRVANVLSFRRTAQDTSAVLGSTALVRRFDFDAEAFTTGWVHLDLFGGLAMHALRPALSADNSPGRVFRGLPAIGFWAMNLVNGQVADGVLANYGGTSPHVGLISCTQCPSL